MSFPPMTSSAQKSQLVVTGLGMATASVLGLAVPSQGLLVLGCLLASVAAFAVFLKPILGLFFLVANIPLINLPQLGQGITLTKIVGMGVFVLWLCGKFARRESWETLWASTFFWIALLLLAFCLASAMWATYRFDTYRGTFQLVQLFLWSLLIIDLIGSWRRMTTLIKLLVSAALIAALITLEQYFVEGVKRAGDNIAGGINGTAALLVSIVPFAFYLLRSQESRWWKLVGLLYLVVSAVAVAVTFSRTSYIMLTLVVLAHYWKAIWGRTGRGGIMILTGMVFLATVLVPKNLIHERIQSIGPALQGIITTAGGTATGTLADSRGFHWRVGFAMFHDSPLVGMGYGNYGRLFRDTYQFRVPGALELYRGLRSSHSTYIDFLANGGVLGLAMWLGVLVVTWFHLQTARSVLISATASDQFFLVQALTYTFLLQGFYGWSLTVHQDKFLWMILGLSVAVTNLVKQSKARSAPSAGGLPADSLAPVCL